MKRIAMVLIIVALLLAAGCSGTYNPWSYGSPEWHGYEMRRQHYSNVQSQIISDFMRGRQTQY